MFDSLLSQISEKILPLSSSTQKGFAVHNNGSFYAYFYGNMLKLYNSSGYLLRTWEEMSSTFYSIEICGNYLFYIVD